MSDTKNKALDYFKSNADTKEVFATADGILFLKKADAVNHAKVLDAENPKVETFENKPEKATAKKEAAKPKDDASN